MNERIYQAIEDRIIEILEKKWKSMNFRFNYLVRVSGGYMEQYNLWTKLLQLLYYQASKYCSVTEAICLH